MSLTTWAAFEPDQDDELAVIHLTTRPWSEIEASVQRSTPVPDWWKAELSPSAQVDRKGKGKANNIDPARTSQRGFRRATELDDLESGEGAEDKRRTRGVAHAVSKRETSPIFYLMVSLPSPSRPKTPPMPAMSPCIASLRSRKPRSAIKRAKRSLTPSTSSSSVSRCCKG